MAVTITLLFFVGSDVHFGGGGGAAHSAPWYSVTQITTLDKGKTENGRDSIFENNK